MINNKDIKNNIQYIYMKYKYIATYLIYLLKKYLNYQDNNENLTLYLKLIKDGLNLLYDYNEKNILQLMYYDLHIDSYNNCLEYLYVNYIESKCLNNIFENEEKEFDFIEKISKICLRLFNKFIMPKRSYKKSFIRKSLLKNKKLTNNYIKKIAKKINYLKSIKQPEQRSDEWYNFRSSTLTASNIYKIFISDSSQKDLILEKCKPININKFKNININSPLHWGQKYEPLSTMYYEYINNTKVHEFGCIKHPQYNFLAASPDGIVCDSSSNLYGRMLEIKNVVSRNITGIPKMEYWIQMQLQMEVCNLNECDFLETKFVEYEDYEEYIKDSTNNDKYKGVFAYFENDVGQPIYEYNKFNSNLEEQDIWKKAIVDTSNKRKYEFKKFVYYKLDYISCILVLRNKVWFENILPNIEYFWNIIIYEKETGVYKEREKKKEYRCLIDNSMILE